MWDGMNWRKFPRIKGKIKADILLGGQNECVTSFTENVGNGGVCVIIDRKLDRFDKVKLKLAIDDGLSPVECDGSVVWTIEKRKFGENAPNYDVGIEFLRMNSIDQERIKTFLVNEQK